MGDLVYWVYWVYTGRRLQRFGFAEPPIGVIPKLS